MAWDRVALPFKFSEPLRLTDVMSQWGTRYLPCPDIIVKKLNIMCFTHFHKYSSSAILLTSLSLHVALFYLCCLGVI